MTTRPVRTIFLFVAMAGLVGCGGNSASETPAAAVKLDRAATLAATCSGCHAGPGTAIATFDGLGVEALSSSMRRYKSEAEGTTVMHRLARGYTDADIEALSVYLAANAEAG